MTSDELYPILREYVETEMRNDNEWNEDMVAAAQAALTAGLPASLLVSTEYAAGYLAGIMSAKVAVERSPGIPGSDLTERIAKEDLSLILRVSCYGLVAAHSAHVQIEELTSSGSAQS